MSAAEESHEHEQPQTVEEARERIEQDRAALEETVESLAAKADVTGRAKTKVSEVKDATQARAHDVAEAAKEKTPAPDQVAAATRENPQYVALAAGGIALVVALVIWRRRS